MTRAILIDSSVWIDHFNQQESREVALLRQLLLPETGPPARLLVGDLILMEVLQGFRRDRDFELTRSLMSHLPQVSLSSPALAVKSARHYRWLRGKGVTIRKSIDCLIATWCIEHQIPLLFTDRDFKPFCQYLGLINYADTV